MGRRLGWIVLGVAMAVAPALVAQETAIVAVGTADSVAGCVTVAGAAGGGRSRWFAAYYPDAPALSPAGGCPEDRPHVEPPVVCVAGEVGEDGTAVYLAARGPDRVTYLYRLVDRGPTGTDAFGVMAGQETDDRCGAAAVPTEPVVNGIVALHVVP